MGATIQSHPSLRGVSSNNTGTVELPTKGVYEKAYLRCLTSGGVALTRAQMIAEIEEITVELDGDVKMRASAQYFLDRQKYFGDKNGAGNVDGIIPIDFTRPYLISEEGRLVSAYGMADINNFTINVKFGTLSNLSRVEVLSKADLGIERKLGQHVTIQRNSFDYATTGDDEVSSLPTFGKDAGYLLMAITLGSGVLSKVKTKVDNLEIRQNIDPNLNQVILEEVGRTPQAGYFFLPFDLGNDLTSGLPMLNVKDFRHTLSWTTAPGNYEIITEVLRGLEI